MIHPQQPPSDPTPFNLPPVCSTVSREIRCTILSNADTLRAIETNVPVARDDFNQTRVVNATSRPIFLPSRNVILFEIIVIFLLGQKNRIERVMNEKLALFVSSCYSSSRADVERESIETFRRSGNNFATFKSKTNGSNHPRSCDQKRRFSRPLIVDLFREMRRTGFQRKLGPPISGFLLTGWLVQIDPIMRHDRARF